MTMLLYLLSVLLMQQSSPSEFGSISGRLRGPDGAPVSGVRVAVTPAANDLAVASAMLTSIGQTDSEGHYSLENVMPGRYLIMAGFLASPSYYPGVTTPGQGRAVSLAAGQSLTDLDFTVVFPNEVQLQWLTGKIGVDDGSPLPGDAVLLVELTGPQGKVPVPARTTAYREGLFTFQSVQSANPSGEYAVRLATLPLGYYVKSMTFGNVDLTRAPLKLPTDLNSTQIAIVLTKKRPTTLAPGVSVKLRVMNPGYAFPHNMVRVSLENISFPSEPVLTGELHFMEDGSFEIKDVTPGRYTLRSELGSSTPKALTFDIVENSAPNLELRLGKAETSVVISPGSTSPIRGTVALEDAVPPEFEIGFTTTQAGAVTHVAAVSGGEFSLTIPDGEYRVSISGLPKGYTVESVTAGPLDLTEPFLLTKGGISDRFTGAPLHFQPTDACSQCGVTIRLKAPASKREPIQ